MNKALLIIDVLKDFLPGGQLACERGITIIPNIKHLLSEFRENKQTVIYINDAHTKNDDEFKIWPPHAIKGEKGAEIIDELDFKSSDYIVEKRRYSGFSGTDLNFLLKEKEIETVVLCGLHTHICVRHTAYDAYLNNYKIEIVEDATNAISEQDHISGIEYLKVVYAAKIIQSKEISFK